MAIVTYDVLNPTSSIIWVGTNKLAPNVGYVTLSLTDGSAEEDRLLTLINNGTLQSRQVAVGGTGKQVATMSITDLSSAELTSLAAASALSIYTLYRVGGIVYLPYSTSGYVRLGGSADFTLVVVVTASGIIKSGPAKIYSVMQTSGAATITLRNGTSGAAGAISGYTAPSLTLNTPYTAGNAPTDATNGLYADLSAAGTFIIQYK
jgi:hypothetical protein